MKELYLMKRVNLIINLGWYSVTPEEIAQYNANKCKSKCILDTFCGAGGNAIQVYIHREIVCETSR